MMALEDTMTDRAGFEGRRAAARRERARRRRGAFQGSWLVLACDPGADGAMALIRAWPEYDMPRLDTLRDLSRFDVDELLRLASVADLVVVEAQQASPQMGRSSAFELGRRYGELVGLLEWSAGDRVVYAQPAAWRGSYGLAGGKEGKAAGLKLAQELVPTGADQGAELTRHDQADAVLLAWWGWRKHLLARATQDVQPAGK